MGRGTFANTTGIDVVKETDTLSKGTVERCTILHWFWGSQSDTRINSNPPGLAVDGAKVAGGKPALVFTSLYCFGDSVLGGYAMTVSVAFGEYSLGKGL